MGNLISQRITDLVPKRIYDEYTTRDDLKKLFNLKNFTGIIDFYLWWKEYAEIKEYNYYWLPSLELSNKLYTSKNKNGIYSFHISIANRFKTKNECKKILNKAAISNHDYKKFKEWLRYSYYDLLPNNSYIFNDLSDLGKDNLVNNSKTKFISSESNQYLIISDYLSLILIFLRSTSQNKNYQIKVKNLMIEKSKIISFEYLPEIMNFFNKKILANDSNIKNFFYNYLNELSVNAKLPIFLDMLSKRKDIKDLYTENIEKEFFMVNWWYKSGIKEYKFAKNLKIKFSEKIKLTIYNKFLKKEDVSLEILTKKNIDEFIHNSKSFIIPSFLIYIFNKRSDLKDSFYKSKFPFRLFLLNWWIKFGSVEYPDLNWKPLNSYKKNISAYLKIFELNIINSKLKNFEVLNMDEHFLIFKNYKDRPDLQNAFKNSTSKAESLCKWFLNSGIHEDEDLKNIENRSTHEILPTLKKYFENKDITDKNNFIDPIRIFSAIERIKNFFSISDDTNKIPIPAFLIYIYEQRPDLQNVFYKSELPFRLFILEWWITCGSAEYPDLNWHPNLSKNKTLIEYIKKLELNIINSKLKIFEVLNMDEHFLIFKNYKDRPDLQNAFKNSTSKAESLCKWFLNSGIHEDEDLKNIENRSTHEILPTLKKYFKNKDITDKNNFIDPIRIFSAIEIIKNFFSISDDTNKIPVPAFLIYIYEQRPDLQNVFYKSELPFRLFILEWWIICGSAEYPDLKWKPSKTYKKYLLSYIKNLKLKITRSEPAIYDQLFFDDYYLIFKNYQERPDLQNAFKNSSSIATSLYNWFINSGVNENESLKNIKNKSFYEIIPTLEKYLKNKDLINNPKNLEPLNLFKSLGRISNYFFDSDEIVEEVYGLDGVDGYIPSFLFYIYEERSDIKNTFYKSELPFRLFILEWWIKFGSSEYQDFKWEPSTTYKKNLLSYIKNLKLKITKSGSEKYKKLFIDEYIMIFIQYQERPDLQNAFKNSSSIATSLYSWFINTGVNENEYLKNIKNKSFYEIIPSLEKCFNDKKIWDLDDKFYESFFKTTELIKNYFEIKDIRKKKLKPVKVKIKSNLFRSILHKDIVSTSIDLSNKSNNYAKSEIAIVGFHNYQLGISEDARNIYKTISGFKKSIKASNIPITSKNKLVKLNYKLYSFIDSKKSIIVLPPTELITLYVKNQLYFNSKIMYALIPWELSKLNRSFVDILSSFDLLLAPSKFIRNSLLEVHKNVKLLPHFIDLDKKYRTQKYKEFTFLYSADLNSFIQRKNPFCAIKAFKIFLKKIGKFNKKEPKLILRLSNLRDEQFKEIKKHTLNISNIILITKQLDREEYINLLAKSHCFVSPHRSEGFGRNIAEAMFLNTPVIASAYSGNLDFCFENNSYLINGKLIPLKRGDYPCYEDSSWFDPDYLHLSELMHEVYTNYDEAIKKSKLAKKTIENNHSLDIYKKNLKKLLI